MANIKVSVITGANGFVGSHLVDLLLSKGHEVRCITRKSSNLQWLKNKNVKIFDCGLTDKKAISEAFRGANHIYHVAGVVKSKKPDGYFKGNVDTTRVLLDAALENRSGLKKFLIVSSLTVGGPAVNQKPVKESDPPNPITTYGRSKLAEEELARTYMNKLPIVICRAPAVYGERDTEIFIFFNTFSKGLFTTIGFDKKLVSLIHVVDLVNGFYLAAGNYNSSGKLYYISSEKFYTWEEVGAITSKVLNKKAIHIKVPHAAVYKIAAIAQFFSIFSSKAATLNLEKAKDITRNAWICDPSRAMNELGFRQKISIEEGIKRTCQWYKEQGWIK